MSGQLWGTCQECGYRKRLMKDGTLYNHKAEITDPGDELYGARRPCIGGGEYPAAGTARNAAGDTPEELNARKSVGLYPPVGIDTWEDDGGFWARYYWCVVGTGLLILLAFGAFAGGVIWGRR